MKNNLLHTEASTVTHFTHLGWKQYTKSDCTFRDEIADCEDSQCEGTKEEVLKHLTELLSVAESDEREALSWESRGSRYARGEDAVRMIEAEIARVEKYAEKFLAAKAEGMDDDDAITAAMN